MASLTKDGRHSSTTHAMTNDAYKSPMVKTMPQSTVMSNTDNATNVDCGSAMVTADGPGKLQLTA